MLPATLQTTSAVLEQRKLTFGMQRGAEPVADVVGGDGGQGFAEGVKQRLPRAGRHTAQRRLELREHSLDRVEVRAVRWQK